MNTTAGRYAIGLGVIWLLLIIISVVAPVLTPAEGDGFTRGLNRLMLFFTFQFVAIFVAIAALYAAFRVARPRGALINIAGFVPAIMSGLLVLSVAGFVLWTNLGKPDPVTETPPATSPPAVTAPGT